VVEVAERRRHEKHSLVLAETARFQPLHVLSRDREQLAGVWRALNLAFYFRYELFEASWLIVARMDQVLVDRVLAIDMNRVLAARNDQLRALAER